MRYYWYKLIKQVRSKVHFFQILSGPSLHSGENRCEHPGTNHFRGSLSMMKWSSAGTPSLVCVVFRILLGLGVDHFTAKRHWGLPDHRLHDSVLVRRPDHEIRGQGRRRDGGRSEATVQHQGPVDVESQWDANEMSMRCQCFSYFQLIQLIHLFPWLRAIIAFDCASLRGLQGQDFAGWEHLSNQRIASAWNQLGESACYAGEG